MQSSLLLKERDRRRQGSRERRSGDQERDRDRDRGVGPLNNLRANLLFDEFFGDSLLEGKELSGPVLRDTARLSQRYPPIARYGVLGVSTWPIGCDTLSPFSEHFPLGEHAKWRCDTPPQKGYLSDTCAIPYEKKANGCDTPLCDTISKGYCAIWGGISHWAAKGKNLGHSDLEGFERTEAQK